MPGRTTSSPSRSPAPDRGHRIHPTDPVSPGAIVAVLMWLLFSLAFSFYVNNFGSYNATYGTLAGIIILLLYIYYSAFIVLFGAELNQVIEEHIPEGKNEGEKSPGTEEEGPS